MMEKRKLRIQQGKIRLTRRKPEEMTKAMTRKMIKALN
tara:strand:- start:132 stop:245 length:114 start_codon:yes stop_codon:yes gene_type:complete